MGNYLRYVGGGAFLPGVPAADHETETKEEADALVASGLYKRGRAARTDESAEPGEEPTGTTGSE